MDTSMENHLKNQEEEKKRQKEEQKKKKQQKDDKKVRPPWKDKLDKFLNVWQVTLFMTTLTVYALFADDVRLIAFEKPSDDVFNNISFVSLIFFFLELLLASIGTEDYFLGFYFWLDLVATLSLLTDVAWIWDPIVGTEDI
jgi:membrane-bound ClpP family serine protease